MGTIRIGADMSPSATFQWEVVTSTKICTVLYAMNKNEAVMTRDLES